MAESEGELKSLLMKVKEECEKAGELTKPITFGLAFLFSVESETPFGILGVGILPANKRMRSKLDLFFFFTV